jgi:arabinofuranosyltransferase
VKSARFLVITGFMLLVISLIRTAWLSDDAYITFRTADNVIHGYGLVWNTAERVQTFTHPLWLALITPAFALTGEVYYTAIVLSMVVTLAAVALLARRLAATPWNLVVCLAALLSSKAFIDFSTSGLENPLTHLLLFAFMWVWWDEPALSEVEGADGVRRMRRLSLVAALCLLNRLDLAPLLAPAIVFEMWRLGPRRALGPAIVGFAPLIAWELFSTFYYGTPLPNTAYAKLNTVLAADVRLRHGVDYLLRTLEGDPVTLPVIAASLFAIPLSRYRRDWPIVVGLALFMTYVLRIGGDWMMGRFLTPAFAVGIALLARARWIQAPRPALVTAGAVVIGGLFATWEPAILSGYGYSFANNLVHGRRTPTPMDNETKTFLRGVMDERRYYYEATGLLKTFHANPRPHYEWSVEGLRLRDGGGHVIVHINIGMLGYFGGPRVHVIDLLGLGDPLLARIPGGVPDSPIGHFPRALPVGYVDTIETGNNHLRDPDLAAYYDRLHLVNAGPLWSGERLVTLVKMLAGRYDDLLARYLSRASARTR